MNGVAGSGDPSSYGRVALLRGEEPVCAPERLTWLAYDGHSAAVTVCLTQWRLLLYCPAQQHITGSTCSWLQSMPVSSLANIEYVKDSRANILRISAKHIQPVIELLCERNDQRLCQIHQALHAIWAAPMPFAATASTELWGWGGEREYRAPYSWHAEFARLGLPANGWRLTDANTEYQLCHTYPQWLVVPNSITDSQLAEVAAFRHGGRIPAVCWRNPDNGTVLIRSAQPAAGLFGGRCTADERLVKAMASFGGGKLVVVDCRPKLAEVANRLGGGGAENAAHYHGSASPVEPEDAAQSSHASSEEYDDEDRGDECWQVVAIPIDVGEQELDDSTSNGASTGTKPAAGGRNLAPTGSRVHYCKIDNIHAVRSWLVRPTFLPFNPF
eukprot:SAG31_NODE_1915_length_6931_cov_6.219555_1_plen_386_part_00